MRPLGLLPAVLLAVLLACRSPSSSSSSSEEVRELSSVEEGAVLATVARRDPAERAAATKPPTEISAALRIARLHLERSRLTEDSRELGYAQAALQHWWDDPSPPPEVRAMRATLLQRDHRFALAVADLKAVVAADPKNGQAWLTLASVELVRGELDEAEKACSMLPGLAAALVATTCSASVSGMRGASVEAVQQLVMDLEKAAGVSHEVLGWSIGWLAELLDRSGDARGAANSWAAAIRVNPSDPFLRYAFADHLLEGGQNGRALEALGPAAQGPDAFATLADGSLLRVAISRRRLGHPEWEQAAAELDRRFAQLRARGDRGHLREEARHQLAVRDNPKLALRLALENWAAQREAVDVRLVLQAARSAGPEGLLAAEPILGWISRVGFDDARVRSLLVELKGQDR